jgi:DNA invertase Pin-like site-specific DNA recombinase
MRRLVAMASASPTKTKKGYIMTYNEWYRQRRREAKAKKTAEAKALVNGGMSQRKAAKTLGISKTTIVRYLRQSTAMAR